MEGKENRTAFGCMPDGTRVDKLTLRDGAFACEIITYGGAVRSLVVPDRDGNPVDVVLGFDTLDGYRAQDKYIGALVGRYANRIGEARFTLNGVEYKLAANDGENSLHGGDVGFDKQVWTVEELSENAVTLSLVSPDMQEGYPGTLTVRVTYALSGSVLRLDYWAWSDKDTVFNPTNHTYFNLSGHDSGGIGDHFITICADRYTPIGPGLIPTGKIAPVDGTPMDLRGPLGGLWVGPYGTRIGDQIDGSFQQLALAGGYDHNWVINKTPNKGPFGDSICRPAAGACSFSTGISLHIYTTMPGVQFYAGNYLDGCPAGKGGAPYAKRHGFCLETQFFPDSPNRPGFPSCVLRAGEEYRSRTEYCFGIRPQRK